ncbi:unnamed protein product [Clavelina lepadiformis]|uniref:Uncharacterized protein n=1 Tax=Clavelina lepadiformis TaxID=159417 RepID=A0ABP0G1R4_CLALP
MTEKNTGKDALPLEHSTGSYSDNEDEGDVYSPEDNDSNSGRNVLVNASSLSMSNSDSKETDANTQQYPVQHRILNDHHILDEEEAISHSNTEDVMSDKEEDNLHGLSVPEVTSDNDKAHKSDNGSNQNNCIDVNPNKQGALNHDLKLTSEDSLLADGKMQTQYQSPRHEKVQEKLEEMLNSNKEAFLNAETPTSPISSASHKTNDTAHSLSYDDGVEHNSVLTYDEITGRLEHESSSNAKQTMPENHAVIKPTTFAAGRLKRVNPFNNMNSLDEAGDLWQMRTSPLSNTTISSMQSSASSNSSLPSFSSSGSVNQPRNCQEHDHHPTLLTAGPSYHNPPFQLMPKLRAKQNEKIDVDDNANVEDIEAAVREVKLRNSHPVLTTPELDNPWVKVEPDIQTLETNLSIPVNQPVYSSTEPDLPSSELQDRTLPQQPNSLIRPLIEAAGPCEPADLIEGIIFSANYLGSTQLQSERNPGKNARMMQAQEAVHRIKAPEGESQPSVEVDLFISTDKIKILNADTQETMMDHTLRSISYIADIGKLLVIMAKRRAPRSENPDEPQIMRDPKPQRSYRIICHVFSSVDSNLMAQAIGQSFNVAYQQFLISNGIEPQTLTRDDYNELLDMQDMYHDDLVHYSNRENVKDVWVEKKKGEPLGVVIVESGWGSIVPTVILANLQHGGPAEKCGKLSIGDQIMTVNGTSLVGLPITTCQSIIKGLRAQSLARLNIVSCPPVVTVLIKRPDLKYQLGFSVQEGIICSLMRGGIAERGGVRVGHRIIEINGQSVVATPHEKIVQTLVSSVGEIQMKTMPGTMYRLLTGQEQPVYI